MPTAKPAFRFTGWHMTAILVAFFGVVVGVNFTMARLATSTFSGVVVKNSYDASQQYNKWLDEAAKEKALGWKVSVERLGDGRVSVRFDGKGEVPVPANARLSGEAWHILGQAADHDISFARGADGVFVSSAPLAGGRWHLRLKLEGEGADGQHVWRGQESL
jgi:nitrogen fixation protein FixH